MSLLDIIGITSAYAFGDASSAAAAHPSPLQAIVQMLPMLIIIVAVFYFLFIRPQSKRAKEQRTMLDSLAVSDEIMTAGGIVGKVSKILEDYIVLSIAPNVEMMIQKNAIAKVLPKGTLESVK